MSGTLDAVLAAAAVLAATGFAAIRLFRAFKALALRRDCHEASCSDGQPRGCCDGCGQRDACGGRGG